MSCIVPWRALALATLLAVCQVQAIQRVEPLETDSALPNSNVATPTASLVERDGSRSYTAEVLHAGSVTITAAPIWTNSIALVVNGQTISQGGSDITLSDGEVIRQNDAGMMLIGTTSTQALAIVSTRTLNFAADLVVFSGGDTRVTARPAPDSPDYIVNGVTLNVGGRGATIPGGGIVSNAGTGLVALIPPRTQHFFSVSDVEVEVLTTVAVERTDDWRIPTASQNVPDATWLILPEPPTQTDAGIFHESGAPPRRRSNDLMIMMLGCVTIALFGTVFAL